jgi:hypothetical protein
MAWWDRFFGEKTDFKVLFQLYTKEATRGAEVRVRRDGKFYYVPLEHVDGTNFRPIADRVILYASAEEAEHAAVNSAWFSRGERP